MKKIIALVAVFVVQLSLSLTACVNTSYSRFDEAAITDEIGYVIIGAFAHHGDSFYLREIERTQELLSEDPTNVSARNDLAVAHIKLKNWSEAEKELLKIEKEQPNLYKTHANLGVLYKKMATSSIFGYKEYFTKSATHLKKSLEIQPEGHMGLGDYYIRMVEWLEVNHIDFGDKNFLGIAYDAGPEATANSPLINKEYLVTLIKNDMNFADVYIVLGDVLFVEGDYELAARAYHRAFRLKKKNNIAHERMKMVFEQWREIAKGSVFQHTNRIPRVRLYNEIEEAANWLEQFRKVEADLLELGQPVDFDSTLKAMEDKQIKRPALAAAGVFKGIRIPSFIEWFLVAIVISLIYIYISSRRKNKIIAQKQAEIEQRKKDALEEFSKPS